VADPGDDEMQLALQFLLGKSTHHKDGRLTHRYFDCKSAEGRERLAALIHVLRNALDQYRDDARLRFVLWALADHFELNPPFEHEHHKLAIVNRHRGMQPNWVAEQAAVVVHLKVEAGSEQEAALKEAECYGVSRESIVRALTKLRKELPIIRDLSKRRPRR
jgi:hypothetical protein